MAVKTKLPQHRLIAERIRRQIASGELRPGERLPTYRELMEAHGTTVVTVRQAMMLLQSDGVIETVPGHGSVVAETAETWRMVGVAAFGDPRADFVLAQLPVLHDEFQKRRYDISVRLVPEVNDESIRDLRAWARRLDGVILTGSVPVRADAMMADCGVPVIQLGEPVDGRCPPVISSVSVDLLSIMRLAVGHLVGLGHRRIVLCSHQGTYYFDLVSETFRQVGQEYGLADEVAEWYFDRKDQRRDLRIFDWLAGRPATPTALIVEESGRAGRLVRWFNEHGWPVPERISVLGLAAVPDQPFVQEGLSCVLCPLRDAVLRAVEMVPEMIEGGGNVARMEKIAPVFIPGRTCRWLGSENGKP